MASPDPASKRTALAQMARLSQLSPTAPSSPGAMDVRAAELTQLLGRLDHSLLHADAERERRLRTSEFERARLASNVEHARLLLTKLEQDALGIKTHTRRQEVQADLNRKRELLDLLLDRMNDLRQVATDEDEEDDSSEGEDLLGEIIPTPSESMDSRSADIPPDGADEPGDDDIPDIPLQKLPSPESPLEERDALLRSRSMAAATETSQTLRARGPIQTQSSVVSSASSDMDSYSSARAALFANRRRGAGQTTALAPQTSTATAEAILDHQRQEQDALSDSILQMATALKASSQRFSTTLEMDKEVLSKAGQGMEKTELGMESATRRMGTLKKMTEGKGWWGRMLLYAWVYGMMVVLLLLVFVMPKIRFR